MRKLLFVLAVISLLMVGLTGCEELPENKATATKKSGAPTAYPVNPSGNPAGNQGAYPAGKPGVPAATNAPYPAGGSPAVLFQIARPDKTNYAFTRINLDRLPKANFKVGNETVSGVLVTDILKEAKISSFKKITVTGANGVLELTSEQVDVKVYVTLSLTNGPTFVSLNLPADKAIKGITQIKVE